MKTVINQEQLAERARNLSSYNGMQLVYVSLEDVAQPAYAWLDIECYNSMALQLIADDVSSNIRLPTQIFSISGGTRYKGDSDEGPVQVTELVYNAAEPKKIRIKVAPVGDYSTYNLSIDSAQYDFDPIFSTLDFQFRPGCFNTNCSPLSDYEVPDDEPVIDYLVKDYSSFKHVMINAMRERVPGWEPTSEADLDMVLLDLIAANADELSDYQDRVMNEAYFGRSRKRLSLARYARLMDYHIHQGNQAGTQVVVKVGVDGNIDKGFGVWNVEDWQDDSAIIFITSETKVCYKVLNELYLYSWDNVVTALDAGATQADLTNSSGSMSKIEADDLVALLQSDDINELLIQQHLNLETGTENGVDKTARQIVQLHPVLAAEAIEDPINTTWLVRVYWRDEDKLQRCYCFIGEYDGTPVTGISGFHGNLVNTTYGRPQKAIFKKLDNDLSPADKNSFEQTKELYYQNTDWGVLCNLPNPYLAYQDTAPGGDIATRTSLSIEVDGISGEWNEQSDFIESQSDDFHFIVETDEMHFSRVRFGNNINGRALSDNAEVICHYQIGLGSDGNIGADVLTYFDNSATGNPNVIQMWNPMDVTNGRDEEKPEQIVRRVPQAYRAHQLRAVTLDDYIARAEELEEVSHAYARYAWTGSWRTVRVSIDPKGTDEFKDTLRKKINVHLGAVRLIGEDLEIRGAEYIPLDILLKVCIHPDYWVDDLANELEQEFSEAYTKDGRMGFFNPDNWTFGQSLHASQIIGRALSVTGVERVLLLSIRRWHSSLGAFTDSILISPDDLQIEEVVTLNIKPDEIIQLSSDPAHLEKGRIQFDIVGGRGS